MRRPTLLLSIGLAASLLVLTTAADKQRKQPSLKDFMRPKLDHAQKLLEGLTLEQFDVIGKEAQALSLLSRESEWNVLQTEEYLQQSLEFRRAAESIRDAAAKQNLDRAALGYVTLTLKCVNCHKYVRDVRTADSRPPSPRKR